MVGRKTEQTIFVVFFLMKVYLVLVEVKAELRNLSFDSFSGYIKHFLQVGGEWVILLEYNGLVLLKACTVY